MSEDLKSATLTVEGEGTSTVSFTLQMSANHPFAQDSYLVETIKDLMRSIAEALMAPPLRPAQSPKPLHHADGTPLTKYEIVAGIVDSAPCDTA